MDGAKRIARWMQYGVRFSRIGNTFNVRALSPITLSFPKFYVGNNLVRRCRIGLVHYHLVHYAHGQGQIRPKPFCFQDSHNARS